MRRELHVSTTEPGLQFYDAYLLDASITKRHGRVFDSYAGLCSKRSIIQTRPIIRTFRRWS
jgi:hypothetical protein